MNQTDERRGSTSLAQTDVQNELLGRDDAQRTQRSS